MRTFKTLIPAINYLNEFYNEHSQEIIEKMNPLIGEKLFTFSGDKTKKHQVFLEQLCTDKRKSVELGNLTLRSWFSLVNRHLYFKFKICLSGNFADERSYCHYIEKSIYVGLIENGKLIQLSTSPILMLNKITIEEEEKKMNHYYEMEKQLRLCRSEINEHLLQFIR